MNLYIFSAILLFCGVNIAITRWSVPTFLRHRLNFSQILLSVIMFALALPLLGNYFAVLVGAIYASLITVVSVVYSYMLAETVVAGSHLIPVEAVANTLNSCKSWGKTHTLAVASICVVGIVVVTVL